MEGATDLAVSLDGALPVACPRAGEVLRFDLVPLPAEHDAHGTDPEPVALNVVQPADGEGRQDWAAIQGAGGSASGDGSSEPVTDDDDDSSDAYSDAEPVALDLWSYAWGSATPFCEALVSPARSTCGWALASTTPSPRATTSSKSEASEASAKPRDSSTLDVLQSLLSAESGSGATKLTDRTVFAALRSLSNPLASASAASTPSGPSGGRCTVLELGAGLGQLAKVSAVAGATLSVASDNEPAGVLLAAATAPSSDAASGACGVLPALYDWTRPWEITALPNIALPSALPAASVSVDGDEASVSESWTSVTGGVDLLLGSDVFYAPDSSLGVALSAAALLRHGGSVLIADPGRAQFDRACERLGVSPTAHTTVLRAESPALPDLKPVPKAKGRTKTKGKVVRKKPAATKPLAAVTDDPTSAASAAAAAGSGAGESASGRSPAWGAGLMTLRSRASAQCSAIARAVRDTRLLNDSTDTPDKLLIAAAPALSGSGWALWAPTVSDVLGGESLDTAAPGVRSPIPSVHCRRYQAEGEPIPVHHGGPVALACRVLVVEGPVSAGATREVALKRFRWLHCVALRPGHQAESLDGASSPAESSSASVAADGGGSDRGAAGDADAIGAALVTAFVSGATAAIAGTRKAADDVQVSATAQVEDAGTGIGSTILGGGW